jgi:hypothetical protein
MPFDMNEMLEISARTAELGRVVNVDEDLTRQEFKEECDVNHILRQHGYMVRPVVYGEHNFDDDLTAQMQSRSVFQLWYDAAPQHVRDQYPDLGSFLAAFGSGALRTGLEPSEVPSEGSSPSASPLEGGALG